MGNKEFLCPFSQGHGGKLWPLHKQLRGERWESTTHNSKRYIISSWKPKKTSTDGMTMTSSNF